MSDHAAPPVESLFRDVRRRRLRVNNLFQTNSGLWRANLRTEDGQWFHDFGNGVDAAHALEEALRKADQGKPMPPWQPPGEERLPNVAPAEADEDLIG